MKKNQGLDYIEMREKRIRDAFIFIFPYIKSNEGCLTNDEFDKLFLLLDVLNKNHKLYMNSCIIIFDIFDLVLSYPYLDKDEKIKKEYEINVKNKIELIKKALLNRA